MNAPPVSLRSIVSRYKGRITLTLSVVVLEALVDIFFPLMIGVAINDLITKSYAGLCYLVILGVSALLVGAARRFYDTRVYAHICAEVSTEMVAQQQARGASVSKTSARAYLIVEFVEFLEDSLPGIVNNVISLVGVLLIVVFLDSNVFLACVALLVLILIVFGLTGRLNFRLNKGFNDELERQVGALETRNLTIIDKHFRRVMRWSVRLSDLETFNYALVFLGVIALIIYSPLAVVSAGVLEYGLVFSILMYVLQYVEATVEFPLYIQQLIRLQEISQRLSDAAPVSVDGGTEEDGMEEGRS